MKWGGHGREKSGLFSELGRRGKGGRKRLDLQPRLLRDGGKKKCKEEEEEEERGRGDGQKWGKWRRRRRRR